MSSVLNFDFDLYLIQKQIFILFSYVSVSLSNILFLYVSVSVS